MKPFTRILADLALLPISGCIFPDNRDFSDVTHGASPSVSGRAESIRTTERKKALKPRLGEAGLKG